jgi:hypothetical protein
MKDTDSARHAQRGPDRKFDTKVESLTAYHAELDQRAVEWATAIPPLLIERTGDIAPERRPPALARTPHRDAHVTCECCGRRIERRARQHRYCSTRCRMRAHRAEQVRNAGRNKNAVPVIDTGRVTNPAKNVNRTNALQRAKVQSSTRIIGPKWALDIELWDRTWEAAVSSDGIVVEVSRIRARALS